MSNQISQIFAPIYCDVHKQQRIEIINLTAHLRDKQKRLLCEKCDFNANSDNLYNKTDVVSFLEKIEKQEKDILVEFEKACEIIKELKDHLNSIEKSLESKKQKISQNCRIRPNNSLGRFQQKKNELNNDIIEKMSDELASLIMQNQDIIQWNAENSSNINIESLKKIEESDQRKFEKLIDDLKQILNQGDNQIMQQQQQQQQQQQILQEQSQSMLSSNQSFINTPINYVNTSTKNIGEQVIHDVKFNNNGNIVVVSSNLISDTNCYAQVYTFYNNNFTLAQNLDLHGGDVKSICFISQDDNFITACQDKKIRFWKKIEQKKWGLDQELIELKSPANCIKLNHSENYLASGGDYLCFWKKANGKWTYDTESSNQEQKILSLSFNLEDNLLAVGYHDYSVKIFEYYNQKWIQRVQMQKQAILINFFNNKDLIGVQENGYFNYYEYDNEISDYQVVETYFSQQNYNYTAGFCQQKKLLALSPNQQGLIQLHMINENKISKPLQKIPFKGDKLFFSKDGNYLAIISNNQLLIYQDEQERY